MIRTEAPEDGEAIRVLTTDAFLGAEHSDGQEAAIIDALRAAGALSLSLVAVETEAEAGAEELLGHVAFSPVSVGERSAGWFGLGPVSVRPDRQRLGIGTALITEGLARLRALGAEGCVVLGNPVYYGRFGFRADPDIWLAEAPPAYFQVIVFGEVPAAGEVRYHPAFSAE